MPFCPPLVQYFEFNAADRSHRVILSASCRCDKEFTKASATKKGHNKTRSVRQQVNIITMTALSHQQRLCFVLRPQSLLLSAFSPVVWGEVL
mmetsp:Transcript_23498/g.39873  ORF Transcript_23498/g.39873 Transcript_23498/m.39873 type:complete len:92 (+) Transcript_23498:229-504(+)